ncbi:RNA-dependent RNA polymerase SAD-1 [Fusarium heterosporum]|uniref:RNA-dependent RNA polymerase n=1 Tax=Fusarium heterosporum TaxID=42747 RepID=A0A8H5TAR2_FUSHE|nr:RNA-dependent RNA polymerase SAD-1 [Fusarium heterosporum]
MSSRPSPLDHPKGPRGNKRRKRTLKKGRPGATINTRNQTGTRNNVDVAFQLQETWRAWPELTVQLEGLPTSATTSNLWDWFSHEGEISYIDIYETPNSTESSNAKIRFEPPPKRAFWATGTYHVLHLDLEQRERHLDIAVSIARNIPQQHIRSPVCYDRWYPVKMTLYPEVMDFGSMLGHESMKIMRAIDERKVKLELNLRFHTLTAFFPFEILTQGDRVIRQHKVVIDFSNMKNVHQTTTRDNCCALMIPLEIPPQYYWKVPNIRSTFSDDIGNWSFKESWNRATDIVEDASLPMKFPVTLHTDLENSNLIDIGRWTALRFVLDASTEEAKRANDQIVSALDDFNITTQIHDNFQFDYGVQADMWKHLERKDTAEGENAFQILKKSPEPVIQLSFEVRYQLEVCISRGHLNEHTISKEFLDKLAKMSSTRARLCLEFAADNNRRFVNPMDVFQSYNEDPFSPISRIPPYCGLLRKAVITPTTIRYSTPGVEVSNRVMRKYKHIENRFLRIQFTEELEKGKIALNKDQNDEIYKRVLRTMYKGIRIGDRHYEFLAFGNSQLRVNGAYFFCPMERTTCDDIRRWMGQFSHIKVVAKYAARLGQCLSTTREFRGVSSPETRQIPDIERNGHCFTDGVGKISSFLAQLIVEDVALDIFAKPTAFQFRMGGCKGVLAVWPNDAKNMQVHVRESQKKFESNSKGLEIIRCATMATATLNRQMIVILESLGVPLRSFTDLLDQQLKSYELAMQDADVAIDMLNKFTDEQRTHVHLANLLRSDFRTENLQEPFVVNVMKLWRSWSLKLLKEKARIHIQKSAFVLGCVDETSTLRGHSSETEGSKEKDINRLPQIFLQLTDPTHYNKTHIINGVCIVGRNPSLHPGDIRVVEAVDCPALHGLKDVVVFPATGDRPVPNMLSGGDLDGDDFFVIWEPSLIPEIWNYPPMNYSAPKPLELDRDVNVDDLRNFFVKYLKNDKLPLIATSHLAISDRLGPMSSECLELAELHSKAVDYPKTGDPAMLRRDQNPRKWPHFMEKKNSYRSKKALGVIFDKVIHKAAEFTPIWDSPFDQRIIKKFELDNETLKTARKIKIKYDTSVRRLLSQHALKTEFELWTGFAMSKPPVGNGYKLQEELRSEYNHLRDQFINICVEAAGGRQFEKLEPFIAAMYTVTEEETKIALFEHHRGPINDAGTILQPRKLESKSMPLISFPWIFHPEMCRIATGGLVSPKPSSALTSKVVTRQFAVSSEMTEDQASTLVREPTTGGSELGPDIHSRPPDGTVVHRGEPLTIFHPENDADSCQDFHSDNEDSIPKETPGEDEEEGSGIHDGSDSHQTDEEEEDDAMDRLASLIGSADLR